MIKHILLFTLILVLVGCQTGKNSNMELVQTGFNTSMAWDSNGNPIISNHRTQCWKNKTTGVINCYGS